MGEAYWYGSGDPVLPILEAVRRFRRADESMRRRVSSQMDMNLTDMQALRYVIAAERAGAPVTPRQVAEHLGISTASTTKLLDRLADSGRLTREPHPRDRRSLVLRASPEAHVEVRERLGWMHERMREIAAAVPEHSRSVVVDFLDAMAEHFAQSEPQHPHDSTPTPRADVHPWDAA